MVFYPTSVGIDPSGDTTGVIDTAHINQAVQAGKNAQLATGTYYVKNLTLDSLGAITGNGPGSILQAVAGTTGSMIALKTPASSKQVTLRNLQLIPNTGTLNGVSLDNTGFGSDDSRHVLDHVYVTNAGGDAFRFGAAIRGMTAVGCWQYGAEGYGYNLGSGTTDNFFAECVSGPSALHGFNIADGNNHFTACKAFYSGYDTALAAWGTTQACFYLNGVSRTVLAGCTAEQAALNGFDLQNCSACSVTGGAANNNSAGNAVTTGVGVNMNGCLACVVSGVGGNNNGSLTPGAQKYGYQVAGTQTGTLIFANTVTGSSGQFNYVSGGGSLLFDAGNAQVSSIQYFQIPGPVLSVNSPQALTGADTIAVTFPWGVYPVTASGNVTGVILGVPSNGNGQQVTIENKSAFTVTFAAAGTSHVADGTSDVIAALTSRTFTYDGAASLWYRTA